MYKRQEVGELPEDEQKPAASYGVIFSMYPKQLAIVTFGSFCFILGAFTIQSWGQALSLIHILVFWLAWPWLTRTGLGRDERLLMKGTLSLPWIFFPQFHQVFYHELQGHELLVVALALVLPALFHLVCGIAILRWYRRRIRARAFDFTESEAIWDSAQREIDRRLREIDSRDRAQRAARSNLCLLYTSQLYVNWLST